MNDRSQETAVTPHCSTETISKCFTAKGGRAFFLLLFVLAYFSTESHATGAELLGKFNKAHDLFLAHFDSKTDVDDIHSVAAVATMLADKRFAGVSYHAVAGAYGTQQGLYVPANELFKLAFGPHWSDAHTDSDKALAEVSELASKVLQAKGNVWIAEAGQSDFSAALLRNLQKRLPNVALKNRVVVVQHSDWNEEVTTPTDLAFVKQVATYHKIPDGNSVGNGTPGFRSNQPIDWQKKITNARLQAIWEKAIAIANMYNGTDGRYFNKSIKKGGLDFSDVAESAWIFGFSDLADAKDFFREFSTNRPKADE